MGKKDWYWSTGRRSSSNSNSKTSGGRTHQTEIPSGCMCAVFHAFDFHPFNFSINQQQQTTLKSSSAIQNVPKGAEAPRNSLESEDGTVSSISKEEILKFPKNMRIKTSGSTRTRGGGSFDDLSSPGTKTPTLVARLMGLDLLPDANCSSSSSSSCISTPHKQGHSNHHHNRTKQQQQQHHIQILKHRHSTDSAMMRSSARKSYVEHRLSLQINKENIGLSEDLETPRSSFSKRKFDENNSKSPSHYARQIVKQVKESVSRKVGLDITNTVKNREQQHQGGEEINVGQLKFMKSPKLKPLDESSPGKQSSYSPRLSRFNDITNHKPSSITPKNQNTKPSSPITPKFQNTKPSSPITPKDSVVNIEAQVPRVSTKPKAPQPLSEKEVQNKKTSPKFNKTTTTHGNLSSRLNKPPQTSIKSKQEESFIARPTSTTTRGNDIKTKSKRTHPLSNNLLNNLNTVPKTDRPSPPATKIPPKQNESQVSDVAKEAKRSAQLFSCSRQAYKQETTSSNTVLNTRGITITNGESKSNDNEGPEYEYITAILGRTGIHRSTIPNLQFQWYSSTHPLDPSLFHRLELYPTFNSLSFLPNNSKDRNFTMKNHLGPRCNRRLLFDLVDEVLSDILVRPPKRYSGLLLETVWKKVRSFPRAKCDYLEDIDGLIEMEEMKEEKEDEGERLVAEIEGKIVEALVHETLTVMVRWDRR